MITKIVIIFLCFVGIILAIMNFIKDDPPFTIMEKKEKLNEEVKEKIKTMLDEMKKD